MTDSIKNKDRLADRVFDALLLALEQNDIEIADMLVRAMELAMTRNTGGGEFVERRDYTAELEQALAKLKALKAEQ